MQLICVFVFACAESRFSHNQPHIITSLDILVGVRSAFSVNGAMQGVTHGTIRFGRVVTNIGGHYNTSSGNFTCQHPGIYVFHLHLVKFEKQPYAWCNIRMNDADMMAIETSVNNDDTDSHIGSSNSVILNLLHGDIVNIGACSPLYTLHTGLETSFSGFLLQKV